MFKRKVPVWDFSITGAHRVLDVLITGRKVGSSRTTYYKLSGGGFMFKFSWKFFERCFDFIIGVDGDFFFNGGSSVSDSDSEFSSAVIAMNLSNSEKISSSRRFPSMEWRILLPSSRRALKSSSRKFNLIQIDTQTGISSFD
ncbi:hypothetical protein Tco_0589934 [Tanacetum coccineum]